MYRLFVAIDMPPDIRSVLSGICFGVPGAKWIPDEQLHLTLRFIGEVDGGVFRDIREALADIEAKSFAVRLKGVGHFPPRKAPRVLWAGIEPAAPVAALRNRVEAVLVRLGLEPEKRKFSPHITLARLRESPLGKVSRFLAANSMFATAEFRVPAFHLYSSTLTPKGAFHEKQATYALEDG